MSDVDGARGRVLGAMVGLAAGDALGVPVEFEPRAAREADPVRGMRGGGTWKLEPGTWSDDTSLALCVPRGRLELRGQSRILVSSYFASSHFSAPCGRPGFAART